MDQRARWDEAPALERDWPHSSTTQEEDMSTFTNKVAVITGGNSCPPYSYLVNQ